MNNTALPLDFKIDRTARDAWMWIDDNTTRILLALGAAAIIIAILWGAKMFGRRLAGSTHPWWGVIGRALGTMRSWFMAVAAAQIVALYAHPPADLVKTIQFLFTIAATFQAAIFARELILGAVEVRAGEADPHGNLSSALGLIRLAITAGLFVIAIILILSNVGVNVTGLVAGLGVGGIAIGLAAQGIFADLFAALAILFDRPFRKGDAIRFDKTSGTVEEIGLKSTRVRAITGEQVIIANKQLLDKEIRNLARLDYRRIVTTLGVKYETTQDLLERVPEICREAVESCKAHMVRCGLVTFGASTLDYELQYDVHSEVYDVVFATQHGVNLAILKRFTDLGIDFAYPTTANLTLDPAGQPTVPPGTAFDSMKPPA